MVTRKSKQASRNGGRLAVFNRDQICGKWSEREGEAILTAIDESVVVFLVGLVAVALPRESDGGDTFRASLGVIGETEFTNGANGRGKQILKKSTVSHPVQAQPTQSEYLP